MEIIELLLKLYKYVKAIELHNDAKGRVGVELLLKCLNRELKKWIFQGWREWMAFNDESSPKGVGLGRSRKVRSGNAAQEESRES